MLQSLKTQWKRGADTQDAPARTAAPAVDVTGRWDVAHRIRREHVQSQLHLKQVDNRIEGTHQGDFISRDLVGTIDGNTVQISSSYTERHGDALSFRFNGTAAADGMSGTLDMGEYLMAKWSAKRHDYRRG